MASGDVGDAEILAAMLAAPADAWDKLWMVADALPDRSSPAPWAYPEEGEPLFMPHPLYSDAVMELQRVVYDVGLVVPFDWMQWAGTIGYRGGAGLASAPVTEAVRRMTATIREERFCDGAIATALKDGTMTAVLDRIRRWYGTERCAGLGEVTGLVAALASDPTFAASQSSKELFHSNMLAWYLQRWPQAREQLAQAWNLPLNNPRDQAMLGREQHHLDLVMTVAGQAVLVVENKVFALPDEDQLAEYAETVRKKTTGTPALVLLSLTDPGWPGGRWTAPAGGTWTYRSYADLAAALRPAAADISEHDPFAGQMLTRWLNLIGVLCRLGQALGQPEDDDQLTPPGPVRDVLAGVRLDAAVQKMRYQHVATTVHRALGTGADRLRIKADLTHGTGLAEAFTGHDPEFGWQLQGQDFRLAIRVGPDAAGRDPEARAAVAGQHAAYFDFSYLKQLIPAAGQERPAPEAPARYLGFAPNFAYRYTTVPSITAGQAQALGEHYSRRALQFAAGNTTEAG